MTPNLGQGACQAIEDAVVLGATLGSEADVAVVLRRYEARRRPRTAAIQRQSWWVGWVGQWRHPLACVLRDRAVRLLPAEARLRQLDPIVGYDLA